MSALEITFAAFLGGVALLTVALAVRVLWPAIGPVVFAFVVVPAVLFAWVVFSALIFTAIFVLEALDGIHKSFRRRR